MLMVLRHLVSKMFDFCPYLRIQQMMPPIPISVCR